MIFITNVLTENDITSLFLWIFERMCLCEYFSLSFNNLWDLLSWENKQITLGNFHVELCTVSFPKAKLIVHVLFARYTSGWAPRVNQLIKISSKNVKRLVFFFHSLRYVYLKARDGSRVCLFFAYHQSGIRTRTANGEWELTVSDKWFARSEQTKYISRDTNNAKTLFVNVTPTKNVNMSREFGD